MSIHPEKNLALLNRRLHLMESGKLHSANLPIDYFLRSLAEDVKEKAVGIILSGTGTDGALGLKAIKGVNGMTMVQEPSTARTACRTILLFLEVILYGILKGVNDAISTH